jgi:hypothetical protein
MDPMTSWMEKTRLKSELTRTVDTDIHNGGRSRAVNASEGTRTEEGSNVTNHQCIKSDT